MSVNCTISIDDLPEDMVIMGIGYGRATMDWRGDPNTREKVDLKKMTIVDVKELVKEKNLTKVEITAIL